MRALRSLRVTLSAVFLLFLLLVSILGVFSIRELRAVNRVSAEIRDRWLQSTRILGDLNNYTSDARAAEASRLLARTDRERADVDAQIRELYGQVEQAQRAYQRIPHDAEEASLYRRFADDWRAYSELSAQVLSESRRGDDAGAMSLYWARSTAAYDAASNALGVLTDRTVLAARRASDRAFATYETARSLIVAAIALAAIGLVAAINYIVRRVSGPLLALAAQMRSLAANDTQIEVKGTDREDEIGEMARAVVVFRANAIELAHSQQGLMKQATMLEERLEVERKLTAAQRNFVTMMSHELRTPLTVIDGHAQRLATLRDRLSPDDIADRVRRIREAVQHLTQVMEHLLESSRLADGSAELYFHPESFSPAALLHEVCHAHREIAPGSRIVETIRDVPETMVGDHRLLYQAFSNLISNAIKYSTDGDRIDLQASADTETFTVTITDRGVGIPPSDVPRVFDRHHRGANVGGVVGAGIGLYLVKMIVDLHGGVTTLASREGRGSVFTVRLPLDPPTGNRGLER
jgi:two-component system, OmpR family, sensor kinase